MFLVPIDETRFTAAGLTFDGSGTFASFQLSTGKKIVNVGVEKAGTDLRFFPERSALHRVILAILGEPVEPV